MATPKQTPNAAPKGPTRTQGKDSPWRKNPGRPAGTPIKYSDDVGRVK